MTFNGTQLFHSNEPPLGAANLLRRFSLKLRTEKTTDSSKAHIQESSIGPREIEETQEIKVPRSCAAPTLPGSATQSQLQWRRPDPLDTRSLTLHHLFLSRWKRHQTLDAADRQIISSFDFATDTSAATLTHLSAGGMLLVQLIKDKATTSEVSCKDS
ncbi:hypothetical protein L1987_52659 [Smallanthus sonchifolius]|uniref:Uncharacterized protein n=1 Tax=Smallanthus sonchifolius TaxID=185202 RepID=A0ACB9ET62_9ASTR|nr:hypothetical protein L1987_52659 [Smallanthus sonchifolius]